jgi:hypothetical protein
MSFTVVYRTGGYLNAKWHRCEAKTTLEDANTQKAEVERMGYKAIVRPTNEWDSIGLPVGWCPKCDSSTGECTGKGECAK